MKKSLILILFLILSVVVSMLLSTTIVSIIPDGILAKGTLQLLSYIILFGSVIILMSLFGKSRGWVVPNFMPKVGRLDLSLILLSLLMTSSISVVLEPLMEMMPDDYLEPLYNSMQGGLWAIGTAVIAAPILEEFLFRGVVQQNLSRFLSPIAGIIIASLIFGLIHIIPQQVITATLSGIVIGSVYYLTGSLVTVVLIHMLNNGLAYMAFLFLDKDTTVSQLLGLSDSGYWVVYALCVVLLISMCYFGVKRIGKLHKSKMADEALTETVD